MPSFLNEDVNIVQLATVFTLAELEANFDFDTINNNIDEIYNILVGRGLTPFISVCYRTSEVQVKYK